jgi:hypothetical protein
LGVFTLSDGTSKLTVRNNVASGGWHHGFRYNPSKCDDTSPDDVFQGNVAHSISGYGAIAANVENDCTEVVDWWAYKCTEAAIMHGGPSRINRGTNINSIDTRYGIAIHAGGNDASFNEPRAEVYDSKVYAELKDNKDCAEGQKCDHCMDRTGMILDLTGAHIDK